MSTCIPTPRQLEYHDWEFGIFLHFGIRTFYEGYRDWDGKPMEASAFMPSELDCDQWAATAKRAGAKYIVLTAKHHDGFAIWPSKYTDFSVEHSSWRGGKGDVIADYVAACRKHDLKVGLYYSPADASSNAFQCGDAKAYDDYFIGQISEILTGYGQIDILWFDGCHSEGHDYDWVRILREIRRMQPNILIFNMGDPDFRWVGNECGVAPLPCWNTVSEVEFSVLAEGTEELTGGGPHWLPAECDCRMRDHNWFYSDQDEHTVKNLAELMGLYYYSVGRGANLLINIGPDRRGLLPDLDAQRLIEFGDEIARRFSTPSATLATAVVEGDTLKWTFADRGLVIDHVILQEDQTKGEHIRKFSVEAEPFPGTPGGKTLKIWEGQNIGHKAICAFPTMRLKRLVVKIIEAEGPWALRSVDLIDSAGSRDQTPAALIKRENIEWEDVWVVEARKPTMPRVLLIGDSIVKSYYDEVARLLDGQATVSRVSTSKSLGDPMLIHEALAVVAQYEWDVIHFNNGLHGRDYSTQEYIAAFPVWVDAICRAAPRAKLIWAATTPERNPADLSQFSSFNDEVIRRNAAVAEIVSARGIPTNDLNALGLPSPGLYSQDGTHFSADGAKALGRQVAEFVKAALVAAK